MLHSGKYGHHTDKGEQTIRVFGLNRPDLVKGRRDAFCLACSTLVDRYGLHQDGGPAAERVAQALLDAPFVGVVRAMASLGPTLADTVVGRAPLPLSTTASRAPLGLSLGPVWEHVGGVDAHEVNRARAKLALFVADVFASVPRKDQRAKGDCYLRGLMLDGRRKSIQPMAERLPDGNEQNLQQFVNQSTWDPVPVRRRIAQRMVPQVGPDAWAVDDVSFPKDGKMSVAVAHQYCGALGKQANCQRAVSVHAVSDTASCPLQWRLFVNEEWAADAVRRRKTGIPDEVGHREKWRLALDVLDELAGWGASSRRCWWPMPATARTPTSATAWTAGASVMSLPSARM